MKYRQDALAASSQVRQGRSQHQVQRALNLPHQFACDLHLPTLNSQIPKPSSVSWYRPLGSASLLPAILNPGHNLWPSVSAWNPPLPALMAPDPGACLGYDGRFHMGIFQVFSAQCQCGDLLLRLHSPADSQCTVSGTREAFKSFCRNERGYMTCFNCVTQHFPVLTEWLFFQQHDYLPLSYYSLKSK